jgi:hypothetical protein
MPRWFPRQGYDSAIENEDQVNVTTKPSRPNLLSVVISDRRHFERTVERKNAPKRCLGCLAIGIAVFTIDFAAAIFSKASDSLFLSSRALTWTTAATYSLGMIAALSEPRYTGQLYAS